MVCLQNSNSIPDSELTLPRQYLDNVRRHSGPFTDPDAFDGSDAAIAKSEDTKVLSVWSFVLEETALTMLQSNVGCLAEMREY